MRPALTTAVEELPWPVRAPEPLAPIQAGARPVLSVVIPYYRGADVIRQAVESALDQTLPPDEIVICDDGSPDDLEAALGRLHERVTVVRKENGGAASAMNAAARAACGDFVVQLDQDDAFHTRRLEAIAAVAVARPDIDIIATDAVIEYGGKPVGRLGEGCPFPAGDQRTAILQSPFCGWPAIRRERLLAVGGYRTGYTNSYDWECFVRLILDGALVAYVEGLLYRWRLSPGSITSDGAANHVTAARALTDVLARSDLTPEERAVTEAEIERHRRQAIRLEARQAIEQRRPNARKRSFELVLDQSFPPSTRAKAAVAVVSPALARCLLVRRADRDPAHAVFARRGL